MQFKQWNLPLTGLFEITKKRAIICICYFIVIFKFVSAMLVKPWTWKQRAVGSAGKQNNLLSFIDPVRLRSSDSRSIFCLIARTHAITHTAVSECHGQLCYLVEVRQLWLRNEFILCIRCLAGYRLPASLTVHAWYTSYSSYKFWSPFIIW